MHLALVASLLSLFFFGRPSSLVFIRVRGMSSLFHDEDRALASPARAERG